MKKLAALFLVLISTYTSAFPMIPHTQGSLCDTQDKDFVEYRYTEQIPYCKRHVTGSMKKGVYSHYSINYNDRGEYTIDHIIPLAIGGSNHFNNLWPEHKSIKATRYNLEIKLYYKMLKGQVDQQEAIDIILDAKLNQTQE